MTADQPPPPYPADEDVEAILAEFDGDAREAIRALLHDLDLLARDYRRDVSKGYVRATPRISTEKTKHQNTKQR